MVLEKFLENDEKARPHKDALSGGSRTDPLESHLENAPDRARPAMLIQDEPYDYGTTYDERKRARFSREASFSSLR